jgi:hypothetical protein
MSTLDSGTITNKQKHTIPPDRAGGRQRGTNSMADVICFKSRAVLEEDTRSRNIEAALDLLDTMENPVDVVIGMLRGMRRNVLRAVIAAAADERDLRCVLAVKQPSDSRR